MALSTILTIAALMAGPAAGDQSPQVRERDSSEQAWVRLRCGFDEAGVPENCEVVSQSHPGEGFEEAAVRVVSAGRLSPEQVAEADPDATFQVTIRFALDEASED